MDDCQFYRPDDTEYCSVCACYRVEELAAHLRTLAKNMALQHCLSNACKIFRADEPCEVNACILEWINYAIEHPTAEGKRE
jgi:hypothetical protein